MSSRSDEQLMQALADQDMAALGELVRRHQRRVWGVGYRFLGDPAEAEDVAQETFLRLLRAAPRYRPEDSLRGYLYRIASRLCLDARRKGQRLQPASSSRRVDRPSPDADPAETLSERREAARVRQALLRLPPRQRLAVIGKYYEDLSYAEIARSMDISVKAVERLLDRGRRALANELRGAVQGTR